MLYLLRHGEVEMPQDKIFLGQGDPPLSARGEAQARSWAGAFQERGLSAISASDLGRTMRTAGIVADRLGMEVTPEPALREIALGRWEGKSMAEIRRQHPLEWETRGREIATYRTPGGESFEDLQARVVPALTALADRSTVADAPLLLVTHAGVIRTIVCHVLGLRLENLFRFTVSKASLHGISVQDGRWTLNFTNMTPDGLHCDDEPDARRTCHATSSHRH